jgi:hypothetical protein
LQEEGARADELEAAAKQAFEQGEYFDELVDENSQLERRITEFKEDLQERNASS